MYDIKQFKPALFVLLVMGITGFALAAQSPGIWILAVGAVLLNAWLVKTKRFVPLPRAIANGITLLALLYAFVIFRRGGNAAILVIGEFLVLLQLVKLFEQRGNRDYSQLLVLSLLLMVAAAINTASLVFGVLFFCYLFLSLYCCLLFHLKVETDHAKAAIGVPSEKLSPMTLRQDQRYLPRSMRRLTMIVSGAAVAMAVLVFLFFPRNTGAGLLGPMSMKPSQTMTGFSETVSFQAVAQIKQNEEVVAYVKVTKDERPIEGTQPLLLRGVTLDIYTGNDPKSVAWQWIRSPSFDREFPLEAHRQVDLNSTAAEARQIPGSIHQEIMLQPTGSEVLFAVAGVTTLVPITMDGKLHYKFRDQSLRLDGQIEKGTKYEVYSTGKLTSSPRAQVLSRTPSPEDDGATRLAQDAQQLSRSVIDADIEKYARKPDVSGVDANGPLAERRAKDDYVSPLDIAIASNIERHLQVSGFSYTLDLTDARRVLDRDPMVAFLYDLKRGHCEYFAGAMTLMCQSLGMHARMVVGFKCDEYNTLTDNYVVRQSHAHTWVEVLDDKGEWNVFDPTTGRETPSTSATASLWRKTKQVFDYLEFTWANSVVAYDRESRTSLIQNLDAKLVDSSSTGSDALKKAKSFFDPQNLWPFSSTILSILMWVLILTLLGSVGWFVYERRKLLRRAKRFGIAALPSDERLKLARQLGFYEELLKHLRKKGIAPSPHHTPLEFSESISYLPNEVFDGVKRMTEIFYRIRYGQVQLSNWKLKHLSEAVEQIGKTLDASPRLRRAT